MTIWNEDPNDEIWEDLRYWLANPVTEEEQRIRDKEITEYVNSVVDKMFED